MEENLNMKFVMISSFVKFRNLILNMIITHHMKDKVKNQEHTYLDQVLLISRLLNLMEIWERNRSTMEN